MQKNFPIKIYATDVDKGAIEIAANGVYDENISASIPPERLKRYFVKKTNCYHVSRRLRECVIFAVHNIITDPPFHRISLISCRNLLIYFKPLLQLKVLSLFHFSLQEGGFLFLGKFRNDYDLFFDILNRIQ
jgi:two-component system CheB/CheR fusion protein